MRGKFSPIYDLNVYELSEQKDIEYEESNKFVCVYVNVRISNISNNEITECKILNLPESIKAKEEYEFFVPCNNILNHLSGICKITIKDNITIKFQGFEIPNNDGKLILSSIFEIKNTILQYKI